MKELEYVGKSVLKKDAQEKVRGKMVYPSDIKLPDMLHARILRSSYSHAKIVSIDKSKALRVPGVVAVVVGSDYPFKFGHGTVKDTPILAWEKTRYCGEPIAAVAAVDRDAAQEAVEQIEVQYEAIPAVFDPVKAFKSNSPLVHPDLGSYEKAGFVKPIYGTNVCHHSTLRTGNIEEGFKASDRIPAIQHCPLETHISIAQMGGQGRVTIWSSSQAPYVVRANICDALGWDLNRVRVIVPAAIGGGFGSKDFPKIEPIATILALEVKGKPVRICIDRDEEFITKVRPSVTSTLKTGVKKDGTLIALEAELFFDNGAYADLGPAILAMRPRDLTKFLMSNQMPIVFIPIFRLQGASEALGSVRLLGAMRLKWTSLH